MGKRKAAKKVQGPKKREPLATVFTCLFCNHEKAIQVKLDKKGGVGNLYCKICGQRFQTGINYLSAAVDVYSDWVDACENVAQEAAAQDEADRKFSSYATGAKDRGGAAGAGAGAGGGGPVAASASASAARPVDDEGGYDDDDDDDY